MKKLIYLIILFFCILIPALAVCPLNGVCTGGGSPIRQENLQDRYIPDNINKSFIQNNYPNQQNNNVLNNELQRENISPDAIYKNCQFGECFPMK